MGHLHAQAQTHNTQQISNGRNDLARAQAKHTTNNNKQDHELADDDRVGHFPTSCAVQKTA